MIPKRWWTLSLKDSEPKLLPIPSGHTGAITGATCTSSKEDKVRLETKFVTTRADLVDDDDVDEVPTEKAGATLAVIYPKRAPTVSMMIPVSEFNSVSVCCFGGDLDITGVHIPPQNQNSEEEEEDYSSD